MLQRKPLFYTVLFLVLCTTTAAQTVSQKLAAAFRQFEQDPQLQHAIASLYVTDGNGKVVFQKAANIGLAPASTQKIITSVTAYELLGTGFRYTTEFGVLEHTNGRSLYIRGSGDPTLGSWRWEHTKENAALNRVAAAARGIAVDSNVFILKKGWEGETVPAGWIWEDIGNYYGASAGVLNWRENQYDAFLRSSATVGAPVAITGTEPILENYVLTSKAVAAAKGSGDNAYIYFPLFGNVGVVRGTIPAGETRFVISGALPNPPQQFAAPLLKSIRQKEPADSLVLIEADSLRGNLKPFHTEVSPPLDSIIYWLNRKSINLYGEALIKTISFQQRGVGSTETGMGILKTFWKGNCISEAALNLVDGSGLSPLNRVTTQAQVTVLQFAKKQGWFPSFYHSLPEYNGMKLKSGTIRGVKGFAGYYKNRAGTEYVLSFLVNNYTGSASALVAKMYAVLDVLK